MITGRSPRNTRRARLARILDLLAEDDWRNVYAGELEVRPPGAPTIETLLLTPSECALVRFKEQVDYSIQPFPAYDPFTFTSG